MTHMRQPMRSATTGTFSAQNATIAWIDRSLVRGNGSLRCLPRISCRNHSSFWTFVRENLFICKRNNLFLQFRLVHGLYRLFFSLYGFHHLRVADNDGVTLLDIGEI